MNKNVMGELPVVCAPHLCKVSRVVTVLKRCCSYI